MRIRNVLFASTALAIVSLATPALALPKADVADLLGQVAKAEPKIFLKKTLSAGAVNSMSFTFLYQGKGYDFSYNDSDSPGVRVMMWSGKYTQSDVSVDWVGDTNADGIVDSGNDGAARIFEAAGEYSPAEGIEWKPYWQTQYDAAFGALRSFLAAKHTKVAQAK